MMSPAVQVLPLGVEYKSHHVHSHYSLLEPDSTLACPLVAPWIEKGKGITWEEGVMIVLA